MLKNLLLLASAQASEPNYIEDYFNTFLYTGSGAENVPRNTLLPTKATEEWNVFVASGGQINKAKVDALGNIYLVGYVWDGSNRKIYLAKLNNDGSVVWQKSITQTASNYPVGNDIVVTSAGDIYITGQIYDGTRTNIYTAKYNSSGVMQWQQLAYNGLSSQGKGIAIDSNENVYVVGTVNSFDSGILLKYNSSGALQWQKTLTSGVSDWYGVCVGSDDSVYLCGQMYITATTKYGMFVAKYNSSGTIQWQRMFNYAASTSPHYAYFITRDSSDNLYVVGRAHNGSLGESTLLKYNSSGSLLFTRILTLSGTGDMYGVAVTSTDEVYVCGSISGVLIIAKYNTSGTLQWQKFLSSGSSPNISFNSNGKFAMGIGAGYVLVGNSFTDTLSGFASRTLYTGNATSGASGGSSSTSTFAAGATLTTGASSATDTSETIGFTKYTQQKVSNTDALVWIKGRSGATDHALYDTIRGAKNDIASNTTAAATTQSTGLMEFTASGFTVGSLAKINTSGALYAAWTFREKEKFFDIVTYTGNGANRTIAHNLGSVPGMIIIKRTDTTGTWPVYHRSTGNDRYILLNDFAGTVVDSTYWNNTTPTSSEFSVGTNANVNANGGTYVAYIFAHDAGGFGLTGTDSVISCGTFTTGAAGSTTVVNLGWEPQYILLKATAAGTSSWYIMDNVRGLLSVANVNWTAMYMLADNAAQTESSTVFAKITPTGFTSPADSLGTNKTYVYMAIRRGPMKVPTDATTVFAPVVYTGTNANQRIISTPISTDMAWFRQRNSSTVTGMVVGDRLRGMTYLTTGATTVGVNSQTALSMQTVSAISYGIAYNPSAMTGILVGTDAAAALNVSTIASNQIAEVFKRAPGFFDIASYTGTGANATVPHNLASVPELVIVKRATVTTADWAVYASGIANTEYLILNTNAAKASGATYWNSTTPTSSVFSVGTSTVTNASGGIYISYLFASCPGVSKVGTYTGSGTTQQINCGFTSGARFVLIKRTDSTGDWYVYDTARGIIAANDPYILLNSTAAEVTTTDYVDPYSLGFELSSTAPADLNANGGTYIYLAIA